MEILFILGVLALGGAFVELLDALAGAFFGLIGLAVRKLLDSLR